MTQPTAPAPVVGPRGWWSVFRTWPRPVRLATYVAAVLVLALVITLVAGVAAVRRPFPQTSGEIELAGLEAPVEVVRDEQGVPHLYGDSIADLVKAQGYVHAQDRFYEMDVRRHATAGRLAELFGEAALESDLLVRTLGWRRIAEEELALVEPETRRLLEAYADGVTAYLEQHSPGEIAVQYSLLRLTGLDYRPEPWSAVDSLAWLKAMAWDLRGNMVQEVGRALALTTVGPERTQDLYPSYPYDEHRPIVDGGLVVDDVFEPEATTGGTRNPARPAPMPAELGAEAVAALERVGDGVRRMPPLLGRGNGIGSNSWVVSGDHTESGLPLLANDPHLGVSLPGVWHQVGLHCRTVSADCPLDVSGFGFSGVPGVVIGHNADIAWGFTNLSPDVTDLYVERIREDRWLHGGRWRDLTVREETLRVRGGEDLTLAVRSTAHGPIVSDASLELGALAQRAPVGRPLTQPAGEEYAVSLAWTALQPGRTADAILKLNLATDWESFREAVSTFEVPSQNLVYADTTGVIGYQAPGRIPIRKSGNDGRLPAAGWLPENDWTGSYVPFQALPYVVDPPEGFLVTANQAVTGPGYRYHLTDDWDHGYRAQQIRERLETLVGAEEPISTEDLTDLQLDERHPLAATLLPWLLEVELPAGYDSEGQEVLADWDGRATADSAGAAYFNVVWRNLLARTFQDELPLEQWPDGGDRWYAVVERLLDEPRNGWWDDLTTDDRVEDRDDILRAALLDARDEITRLRSRNPQGWSWGDLHRLDLYDATLGTSGIGLVEWLVNRDGWGVGGGSATVNATGWDATLGYQVATAPSMRMVVDLADPDASRWVNLTGVSGHPFHEHFTDQTDTWAAGETYAWPFTRSAVDAAADDTLILLP